MSVKKLMQQIALKYYKTKFKLLSSVSKRKAAEKALELFSTPQTRKNDKTPELFNESEKLQFNINDVTVRGWRFNAPADRKVLILHGYESSVTNFVKYVKAFIDKGYEVLAFDAPAHGRSGGKLITALDYKNVILEIHNRFGPIQSYVAHSFGGLAVALALEEISHTDDYRLALIAPATETSTAINSFFTLFELDEMIRDEFEKIIVDRAGVSSDWYSIRRALQNIKAKVLWLHDEDDNVTPLSDALPIKAENHPNVQFVITKGLGHSRIYRDKEVIKTIVEFL